MTQEFLNCLNTYLKNIKQELPDHDDKAVHTILNLLTIIEYMKTEIPRSHG